MRRRGEAAGFVISMSVLAGIAAVDVTLGEKLILVGLYSVAPLLAGVFTRPMLTAVVGVCATVAGLLAGIPNEFFLQPDHLSRLAVVVSSSVLAVVTAAVRERRAREFERMSVVAEVAQRAILRSLPTALGAVLLSARYVSATTEASIGGDLYEVAPIEGGVRLLVGDVRGKGLEAVQLAARVLGAFRALAADERDPEMLMARLDAVVASEGGDEDFVTALIVDAFDTGEVRIVNCGHHPPVLVRGASHAPSAPRFELLEALLPVPPLGVDQPRRMVPTRQSVQWEPGDRILLYTDGLVEARDARGEFFRIERWLDALVGADVDSCLDELIARLRRHVGAQIRDDLALVLAEHRLAAA